MGISQLLKVLGAEFINVTQNVAEFSQKNQICIYAIDVIFGLLDPYVMHF